MRISLIAFLLTLATSVFAQDAAKPVEDAARYVCDQQRALSLIREQLAETKASDKTEARIRLHLTAADLLWSHRRDLAREWFETAWNESRDFFKQHGKPKEKVGDFSWQGEDFRYVVLRAIAKRDRAWGQALLKELLDERKEHAENEGKSAGANPDHTGSIMNLGRSLLGSCFRFDAEG